MDRESDLYTCARCGAAFPTTASHTEIVRRDFVDVPRPSRIERFCTECWREYVEGFLGEDFAGRLDASDA